MGGEIMLLNYPVHPVLAVDDLNRARKFYEEVLDPKIIEAHEEGVKYECGKGTKLFIYPRIFTKDDRTVAGFEVDDVETVVKNLKDKGVVFEEYNLPNIKTVDGIFTMASKKFAWFKDTEGNLIQIS